MHPGAGISTAAGIPDFRGPNGIWTLEERAKKRAKAGGSKQTPSAGTTAEKAKAKASETAQQAFVRADPTLSHHLLTELETLGYVTYLVTQNVDSLHLRAGFPRSKLAEVHGNLFMEKCSAPQTCGAEYLRDYDVGGVGLKPTGRACEKCGAPLHDTVLDWESALPEPEKSQAESHCQLAELIICLGTSLRIYPVGDWPLSGKQFVIVNLQATPIDEKAKLIIRARIDTVMGLVKRYLAKPKVKEEVR